MSESFAESTPASDNDPYSSTEDSSGSSYSIDRTNFPKPVPIIGPLLGYDDKLFAQVSRLKIEHASRKLQRPLTSEEATALAYWGAKQISIISYGTPIGVAAGAWRCWDTRAKFRFPFYGPNMATFNPMQFPNGMVFVNGPKAPIIWHVFRALFYTGFGKFAASMLTGSYAMSVAAVGEMADPRLKVFRDKLMADAKANRTAAPASRFPQGLPQQAEKQQVETVEGMEETKPYDDASPSGGMFFDQATDNSSAPVSTSQRVVEKVQPEVQRRWPQPPQPINESENRPFSVFDDASPTGGQGVSPEAVNPPAPTGSAWERVRSGQKPSTPPQRQTTGWQTQGSQQPQESAWAKQRGTVQNGDAIDDEFSSSSSREDKKYGRGDAQREFDAKVERERKGGDFASGNGDQKRW